MSVLEIIGIIKLSYRQAEGRRLNVAVLCLKYILSLLLTAAVIILCLLSQRKSETVAFGTAAAASALISVFLRGRIQSEMCMVSSEFLCASQSADWHTPEIPAVVGGELVYIASIWTLFTVLLSPAYICLRFSVSYFSLSADRTGFMLLFAASALLASGGLIFAAVISTRLNCAEYLFFSGQCGTMPEAMTGSSELTGDSCGDLLRMRLLTFFCGTAICSLCHMNMASRLIREKGFPSQKELYINIVSDGHGEKHFELN